MTNRISQEVLKLVMISLVFLNGCGPSIVLDTPQAAVTVVTSSPTASPTPTPTNTSIPPITVSITSLFDGAEIPLSVDISGEYQNVPQDREIWLYVYATYIKKYFLQPIDRFNNGTWKVPNVIVGAPDETGTRYKIGVISVDLADDERLQENSFDLAELPPSSQNLIEITAYRK